MKVKLNFKAAAKAFLHYLIGVAAGVCIIFPDAWFWCLMPALTISVLMIKEAING